jgi:hypothetical protein
LLVSRRLAGPWLVLVRLRMASWLWLGRRRGLARLVLARRPRVAWWRLARRRGLARWPRTGRARRSWSPSISCHINDRDRAFSNSEMRLGDNGDTRRSTCRRLIAMQRLLFAVILVSSAVLLATSPKPASALNNQFPPGSNEGRCVSDFKICLGCIPGQSAANRVRCQTNCIVRVMQCLPDDPFSRRVVRGVGRQYGVPISVLRPISSRPTGIKPIATKPIVDKHPVVEEREEREEHSHGGGGGGGGGRR